MKNDMQEGHGHGLQAGLLSPALQKGVIMIKSTCFNLNLVVFSGCWLPVRATPDDDLRQIFLYASDFCRCTDKPARDGRSMARGRQPA
jgi:hypothetical protein